ncbi:hypothetical protein BofuT4_P028870.1 [Botrytis cinerea T4]|uniref:Uncharacterized protein n=1 Tax=Botryotinia fuckeliana (strain T4) TaxID=999810 RepID=G2Y8T5_BOTF4|nr:hypothetical protein BofuT4_P028870.1 [Botrytis cinerea T4]
MTMEDYIHYFTIYSFLSSGSSSRLHLPFLIFPNPRELKGRFISHVHLDVNAGSSLRPVLLATRRLKLDFCIYLGARISENGTSVVGTDYQIRSESPFLLSTISVIFIHNKQKFTIFTSTFQVLNRVSRVSPPPKIVLVFNGKHFINRCKSSKLLSSK